MSLVDLYAAMERHNWFYEYSDDPQAFLRGERERKLIESGSSLSAAHQQLYRAYRAYKLGSNHKPAAPVVG